MVDAIAVIPARHASSRFPGKPLVPLLGRPMILWVADRCADALGRDHVVVATDDGRIADVAAGAGLRVEMTSSRALTGTDRIAEIVDRLTHPIILNVQGDEPLVDPDDILRVAEAKAAHPEAVINGYHPLAPDEDPEDPDIPKVVLDRDERLLYMSRCAVPGTKAGRPSTAFTYFKQVCIYGYSSDDLQRFAAAGEDVGKGPLEAAEDIEILRFLELGRTVRMVRTSATSLAVDRPVDVARVEAALRHQSLPG